MKTTHMRLFALALFGLLANSAQAAVYIVGTGAGCTHSTIQAAVNAANNSFGIATVRITRSLGYSSQAITVNGNTQELTIEGGYATCDQASPDTTNTIVSGLGGARAPVFNITLPTGGVLRMRRLTIQDGDVDSSGTGGGIRYIGDGILDLVDCLVTKNVAGSGGGIYVEGTGSNTELILNNNTVVGNNTAAYNGGGVFARGVEMTMIGTNTSFLLNKALGTGGTGGFGGGLFVFSSNLPSYAYVGSGTPIFGAFYGNTALYGGGVAIVSSGTKKVELQLYATDAALQPSIYGNSASVAGGGIYVSTSNAKARLWNAVLDGNDAPNGGAVYLASGSGLEFDYDALPASAVPCTIGRDCGRISNNTAATGTNPGSIIYGESDAVIHLGYLPTSPPADARGGVMILKNTGGSVFDGSATTQIHRTVIGSNTTSREVIRQSVNPLSIFDSTIAGNTIGSGSAILKTTNSDVTIQRSILWQPGSTSLSRSGGSFSASDLVASEKISLNNQAMVFDPLFVDPAHDDFGLRAGSPAIDFAPATAGNDRDALGRTRNVDLPNFDRTFGSSRDVGALERQSVLPLVLNSDFDVDLRLWDVVTAGTSTRDSTQNVSGPSNSGAVHIHRENTGPTDITTGLSQCITIGGPGIYALNGWGRGTSTGPIFNPRPGDSAQLYWELRNSGDDHCQGTVNAFGELTLSSTGSWARPAQPVLIPVPNGSYGSSVASIKIYLVAREEGSVIGQGVTNGVQANTTDAWFDGITLDYLSYDTIFKNGFE
ncbi:MAG: hypothetical protein JSS33_06020 [Proteobacteria bacterium]|nr:hypothetical protein [Pseudomonadota bacterium]